MFEHSKKQKKRILCTLLLFCSLAGEPSSSGFIVAQAPHDPHHHLRLSDVREQVQPDVEIAEVILDRSVSKQNIVQSRDGRHEAFTSHHPNQSATFRVHFRERGTRKVYEVRGLPLPHRPFSDLAWANNRTLIFDRWSQPHYGIHYAIDVRRKKLVRASAFPDEIYLEQLNPKARRHNAQ